MNKETIDRFNSKISNLTLNGWSVVDRNNERLECVLQKNTNYNPTVDIVLTLLTCVWGLVWYANHKKNVNLRMRISVDSSGNILEEQIKL